jgi:hypothetical protein
MARSRHRANGLKQAQRWNAIARHKRLQNLKQKREPLIPDRVSQMLAAMKLPKDCRVYNAKLRELLGA